MKITTLASARAATAVLVACTALLLVGAPAMGASTSKETRAGITGVVNLNTASASELQLLPGVGESRAQAILALRKRSGGFRSVDQLAEVKGIGDTMLERLRPHVAVKGDTTARPR